MSPEAWLMLGILAAMFYLLIWNKLPTWMVFLGTFTVCMTLRLAPAQDMLNGFANSGVITVAALYPVAAAMYSTGAITLLSQRFIGLPKSLKAAYLKILPPTALPSFHYKPSIGVPNLKCVFYCKYQLTLPITMKQRRYRNTPYYYN